MRTPKKKEKGDGGEIFRWKRKEKAVLFNYFYIMEEMLIDYSGRDLIRVRDIVVIHTFPAELKKVKTVSLYFTFIYHCLCTHF